MSKIATNKFLELSLQQIPRLLGQLNRNSSSKSYGSFDRAFWHYRTNDISCARYQESVYTLTLLYCSDFEGNIYYKDKKILEWIQASLEFTTSIQRTNGSFDEWYVNEGSFVCTAFLTAALCQTILLLEQNHIKVEGGIRNVIERSARFLACSTEDTVMNQVSGAIFAIAATGKILQKQELVSTSEQMLKEFLSRQNSEGWWSEYGGPDIGYLTLTISYLEKYQTLSGSREAQDAINKAKGFVLNFVHPDNSAGGEYMSRNTEYIIPSHTLPYLSAIKPEDLDDRYLCYILYNWLETGLATTPQDLLISKGEQYFTESSLLRVSKENYFLVANAKKGNSFRIYAKGYVYYDSGVEVSGFSSGILDDKNKVSFENCLSQSSGNFKQIKEPLLTTSRSILFKTWQLVFGRFSLFQKKVKDFLRPRMVSYSGNSDLSFRRSIAYNDRQITIRDVISGDMKRDAILLGMKSAYSAVPSSKYVAKVEFYSHKLVPIQEEVQEGNTYTITRTFNV